MAAPERIEQQAAQAQIDIQCEILDLEEMGMLIATHITHGTRVLYAGLRILTPLDIYMAATEGDDEDDDG